MSRKFERPVIHEAYDLQPCYVCGGKADRLGLFLGKSEGRIQHYRWRPMCRGCFFSFMNRGLCQPTARLYHKVKGIPMREARERYE